jgi:hypothetical protein
MDVELFGTSQQVYHGMTHEMLEQSYRHFLQLQYSATYPQ